MGLLDAFNQNDPNYGMLGLLQGLGQAAMPSRLPVPFGAVMGQAAGGMLQGQLEGNKGRLLQQEIQQRQLANSMALWQMQLKKNLFDQAGLTGMAPPIPSGGAAGGIPGLTAPGVMGGGTTPPSAYAGAPPSLLNGSGASAALDPSANGGRPGPTPAASSLLNAPPAPSASSAPGSSLAGMDTKTLAGSMIADEFGPTAGKIFAAQHPGPTDLVRAWQDYQNAPAQLRPLAEQKLVTTAGERFQLMRNGWAFDKVTSQWMHMPELGEGITGTMDSKGHMTAGLVPGITGATEAMSKAHAAGPASFEPQDYTDLNNNEMVTSRLKAFGGGGPPLRAAAAPQPSSAPPLNPGNIGGFTMGGAPSVVPQVPGSSPTAPPAAPVSPAQSSANPMANLKLSDIFPAGTQFPTRAAPPPGSMYGKPSQGAEDLQKTDADRLATYNKEAAGGQKIYQDLRILDTTLQHGLNTNELAPLFTKLSNVAQGLGVSFPKGYDPNDAGTFDKVATDLVFAALKQLPGQPRVTEIQGLQKANPNMVLPRATNAEIMHAILANQQWSDQRSKLGTQFFHQYPGVPLSYFDDAYNKSNPLADATDKVFEAARGAGWQFPGDQNPGASPATKKPLSDPLGIR